jgi:hypothetical protein
MTATDRDSAEMMEVALLLSKHAVLSSQDLGGGVRTSVCEAVG